MAFVKIRDAGFACTVRAKPTHGFKKPRILAASVPNRFGGSPTIPNCGWTSRLYAVKSKRILQREMRHSWSWEPQGRSAQVRSILSRKSVHSARSIASGSTLMEPMVALRLPFRRRTIIYIAWPWPIRSRYIRTNGSTRRSRLDACWYAIRKCCARHSRTTLPTTTSKRRGRTISIVVLRTRAASVP